MTEIKETDLDKDLTQLPPSKLARNLITYTQDFGEAIEPGHDEEYTKRHKVWSEYYLPALLGMVKSGEMSDEIFCSVLATLLYKQEYERDRDPLTGLYDRRGFARQTEELMAESKRLNLPLTLAYIDFDNFKPLNDKYGHKAGDDFLKVFASIAQTTRKDDVWSRFGGDEFVSLLPHTDEKNAGIIMERIEDKLNKFVKKSKINLEKPLTFTYGLQQWDKKQDADDFINAADQKLKLLKEAKQKYG
ncbi:hypothetical protein COY29_03240 [Candidatus Woesebacteria bacterium CG_4_10_14_0_2_um_filter_39_14]|uniref:GGDEF domain-containing protein n=3 Tax=Microgenomates group TaxID=1794810 RepID=A0A2M6YQ80_9BACT|nr:MAG: hypothetical protein COT04_00905 [Candidatus Shapirobacteria bacterium CG07_land_8_20_14_0_80_39_12]PIZ48680.1 MAG: hypothetical protein COY29_03240 [Candidatus Woesebacteria bacterium CG_4_10_14_0_2_um_filter_39_14]PJA50113.1 MAG: hypothetical protein CO169_00060 [Candidatus Shapirobacteria bacterium CG_4_9_14_3_um_filter_39_13]